MPVARRFDETGEGTNWRHLASKPSRRYRKFRLREAMSATYRRICKEHCIGACWRSVEHAAFLGAILILAACDQARTPSAPSPPASPLTIEFNGLTGTNEVNRGCTYAEGGFTLDYASPCLAGGEFRSIHPPSLRFSDSVSFYNNSQLGITRLTRIAGGSFVLYSIDLDGLNFTVPTTVSFTGTRLDATTVTQSFTTDATFPARETFAFSAAFDNVTEVTWVQSGGSPGPQLPFHQFDNIVIAVRGPTVGGY